MKQIQMLLLIFSVTLCTLVSQLILKYGITNISTEQNIQGSRIYFFFYAAKSPFVWTSILIQGIGFSLWMLVISKYKLGMAFGISGAFLYILLPLSSWILFGEKLSHIQWLGLFAIIIGIFLVTVK